MRFELLFPLLFFLLSLILAVPRSYDPYLYEEDLGEGRLILRVEGVGEVSEKGFSARVKVLGGDFPEIYEKTAFLRVYGAEDVPSKYLEVYGKVRVKEGRIFISATYKDVSFANVPPSLRDRLAKRLEERIEDQEVRALALAYFLGEDQSVVPMRVQSAFLTTGLVHLLVVSGGHLSLLALMLRFLAPYRLGLWLALLGVSFYALFLVPSEPPVLRAYLMILAFILLLLYGERPNLLGILLASGGVILLLFPEYVSSYSFWLSFCATLYILLSLRDPPRKDVVFLSFWVSFFAFLGTMPILSLFSFSAPFSILLTPLLSVPFLAFTFYGFLDMLTFFSLPAFPLEVMGRFINASVMFFSDFAPTLFFNFSLWEAVLSLSLGAVLSYFLKGWEKLLVGLVFVPFLF